MFAPSVASRRLFAVAAALLHLVAVTPAPAAAAEEPPLEQLVLNTAPPSFEPAPPGTPDTGRLTAEDFARLGAGTAEDAPDGLEGFLRQWSNAATAETLVLLVVKLPNAGAAEAAATSAPQAVPTSQRSLFSTGVEDTFGFRQKGDEGSSSSVAGFRGRYAYTVTLGNPTATPPGLDIPIDTARQQRNALPEESEVLPSQEAVEEAAEDFGFAAGTVLVIGGIVAVVAVLVVRGRRRPTSGPAGVAAPGWYPDAGGTGAQRYWDGHSWTEHQTPRPPAQQ